MGLQESFSSGGATTSLKNVKPIKENTTFGTLTDLGFELLDASANFTRSLAAGDPINALKVLTPGIESRNVDITETPLASEGSPVIQQIGATVLLDPLTFATGLLPLTKYGKAVEEVATASRLLKVTKGLEEGVDVAEKIAAATKRLDEAEAALKAVSNGKNVKRALISLGSPIGKTGSGLQLGNADRVAQTLSALKLFPDVRIPSVVEQRIKLASKRSKLINKGEANAKDISTYYHGSPFPFERFDITKSKDTFIHGSLDPDFANEFPKLYSDQRKTVIIKPFKVKGKILKVDDVDTQIKHVKDIVSKQIDKFEFIASREPQVINRQNEEFLKEFGQVLNVLYNNSLEPFAVVSLRGLTKENILKQVETFVKGRITFDGSTWRLFETKGIAKGLQGKGFVASEVKATLKSGAPLVTNVVVYNPASIVDMGTELFNNLAKSKKLIRVEKQLDDTTKFLATLNTGLIPEKIATKIRDTIKTTKAVFKEKPADPLLEDAQILVKSKEARAARIAGDEVVSLQGEISSLAEASGRSLEEQSRRLTNLLENRHLVDGETSVLPKIAKKANEENAQALIKFKKAEAEATKLATPEAKNKALIKARQTYDQKLFTIKQNAERTRLQVVAGANSIRNASSAELSFLDKYANTFEELLAREQDSGIQISKLESSGGVTSYVPRQLSQAAKDLKRTNPQRFEMFNRELAVRLGEAKQRSIFVDSTLREINRIFREDFGFKGDFFEEDFLKILAKRRANSIKQIHRAEFINFGISELAGKGKIGDETVTVKSVLRKANLDVKHPRYADIIDKKILADRADELLGVNRILEKSVFNNKGLRQVLSVVESFNRRYRILLTSVFPAFHTRNEIGNIYLNLLAGYDPIRFAPEFKKATQIIIGARRGTLVGKDLELLNELKDFRVINSGQFALDLEDISKLGTNPIDRALSGQGKAGIPFKVGREVGRDVENHARVFHYLAARRAGLTVIEAVKSMNKHLFDYTQLGEIEKTVLRPTLLFYTWLRKNIPLQIMSTIEDPRLANLYAAATSLNKDDVPDYLRASRSFSLGQRDQVVGQLGLPIEDLSIFSTAGADPGFFNQTERLVSRILSRTTPLIRFPLEVAKGSSFFSNKRLSEMSTFELTNLFNPASRVARTGSEIVDSLAGKTPIGETLIRNLTGIKVYNSKPARRNLDRIKRKALLSGKFQREGFLVIPKQQFKNDPEVIVLKKQLSAANKALRESNK